MANIAELSDRGINTIVDLDDSIVSVEEQIQNKVDFVTPGNTKKGINLLRISNQYVIKGRILNIADARTFRANIDTLSTLNTNRGEKVWFKWRMFNTDPNTSDSDTGPLKQRILEGIITQLQTKDLAESDGSLTYSIEFREG